MIHKKSASIRYKLASLALLLGLFGFWVNSAFAYECNNQSSTISDGSQSAHPYTCQAKNNVSDSLCGNDWSKSQTFGFSCGSTSYVCQRCVCPGGTSWKNGKCEKEDLTCEDGNWFVLSPDKKSCICKEGTNNVNDPTKCVATGQWLVNKCWTWATTQSDWTCTCNGSSIEAWVECKAQTNDTSKQPCGNDQPVTEKCTCDGDFTNVDGICKSCKDPGVCCWIKLNTNVPFVWRCITFWKGSDSSDTTVVTETTAFPRLMWALTKIMTTFLLLICFGGILVGWVMVAASGWDSKLASQGKGLIGKVIIAIAVLWASGIILHLINPNFF